MWTHIYILLLFLFDSNNIKCKNRVVEVTVICFAFVCFHLDDWGGKGMIYAFEWAVA